jgi:hypothetical protein
MSQPETQFNPYVLINVYFVKLYTTTLRREIVEVYFRNFDEVQMYFPKVNFICLVHIS